MTSNHTTGSKPQPASFDVAAVRARFPILSQQVYGKPLTFLDTAASAQKPDTVIAAEKDLFETSYANIHRGVYKFSQDATTAYEAVRDKVQAYINAADRCECLFVRGATEGINLVAQSWGRQNIKAGDEILVSVLEHHSNIVPWQMLAQEVGAKVVPIPLLDDGTIDQAAYKALLTPQVKLLAIGHVSNALGIINPVGEMIKLAKAAGCLVVVDGCQAAPHLKIDVQALDADFYTFSAHKMYGPTGVGVLYGKRALLDAMPPWHGGGDMIERVSFAGTTYNELPYKFEAGTPNISGGIAFGAAIDFMNDLDFDSLHVHEQDLLDYASQQLRAFNSLRIIGDVTSKSAIISFVIDGIHPHDIGTLLDQEGVAVRVGHHCAQPVMDRYKVPGTVRASFGIYNDRSDVDRLVAALKKTISLFG